MKKNLIKIKFLENFGEIKKGEVFSAKEKDAREYVKEGIAEYVNEETKEFKEVTNQTPENKEPFVSKEDFERICSQGKKEDMERLFEHQMILFKEKKIRTGQIKVLNEYATAINPEITEIIKEEKNQKLIESIHTELNEISTLTDSLGIETELKKLKEKYGISLKILREKVSEKKKDYLSQQKDKKELPCEIDPRFKEEELLIHISKELDKDHIDDDREKLGTFIAAVSSELPNPKDHVSVAHKGNSSAGKTNLQLSVIKHFPSEGNGIATRITQSEMEDRIQDWKRLVITEINKHREGGANNEITETFKQVMEDGIRIFKKDNITGEPKEINVPQKTGFYGTTETEIDEELDTRYIAISVRGTENKNRAVVCDTLLKVSDINTILNKLNEKESWIAESIRGLNSELDVVIPFAGEITQKFKTNEGEKELFDFSKERVKRDVKRLMSLTKAIAWLYQKRRIIIDEKIIVAEPTDFLTALKIFTPFFNVSYSGIDPRINEVLETIKSLEGKHSEEILREFGNLCGKGQWIIRTELQKKLGISINTMVKYVKKLKNDGLVDTYWEEAHPKFYLIRPINVPISRLLDPITLQALTGHLQVYCGAKNEENIYKKYKKEKLDTIPLVKSIEYKIKNENLTGVNLTGTKKESVDFSLSGIKEALEGSKHE